MKNFKQDKYRYFLGKKFSQEGKESHEEMQEFLRKRAEKKQKSKSKPPQT